MVVTCIPLKAIEFPPSAQKIADKLVKSGASLEDTVAAIRNEGEIIAEFYINGKLTYWTIGRISFGEPVWHSLYDQGHFIKNQRMCWEQMYNAMDEVHRQPRGYYK
ncbi:MAG: hypothetical protein V1831_02230 [Candidatus Woesearchaeota archaeon]